MADNKEKLAKAAYQSLLKGIELNGWHCEQDDEKLSVNFGVNGNDMPMDIVMFIDKDRQLVRLMSRLPLRFNKTKIMEGAIATSIVNYALTDGSFDYDMENGTVYFRMTTTYRESIIAPEAIKYLLNYATWAIDKFNDKLLMVANGAMDIKKFSEFISGDGE